MKDISNADINSFTPTTEFVVEVDKCLARHLQLSQSGFTSVTYHTVFCKSKHSVVDFNSWLS